MSGRVVECRIAPRAQYRAQAQPARHAACRDVAWRGRVSSRTVIDVRPVEDRDIEALAAIYVDAARAGWAHIFGASNLQALEPPADRLRAEFASTDARQQVLVAEKGGRVIAFAVVRQSRDVDVRCRDRRTRPVLLRSRGVVRGSRSKAHGGGDRSPSRKRLHRGDALGSGREPSPATDL
jgi:hypothetical protein